MELRITFSVGVEEYNGDLLDVEQLDGLTTDDLAELTETLRSSGVDGAVRVEAGSVGKGASGPGVQLIVTVVEHVLTDAASTLAIGSGLWALIRKVWARRERAVAVQQPEAIQALAVAAASDRPATFAGGHVGPAVCLTGGGPGIGTDSRDVWATPTVLSGGDVWIVFTSPTGLVLGQVTVPAEWTPQRGDLLEEDVARVFADLNPR